MNLFSNVVSEKMDFQTAKLKVTKKPLKGNFHWGTFITEKTEKKKPATELKVLEIKKNVGWCDDVNSKRFYNRLIKLNPKIKSEKLFRFDYKYDFFIPIKYNWKKVKIGIGSAIFLHLTKNYKPTDGCIGLREKDFLILIKLIKKDTKIKIL